MKFLTDEEVIAINLYVIQEFSPDEQIGVKFPDLLNSAVNRPQQSGMDTFKGLHVCAIDGTTIALENVPE